ncbi:MAG: hypothetical protein AB7S77_11440 [Desulfatirhabdiaceae bacterium]
MEALRICQKPENDVLIIKLPKNFAKSKELEIIIFPIDQVGEIAKNQFYPPDYFGIWRNKKIDVDKVCKEMREEWDRSF